MFKQLFRIVFILATVTHLHASLALDYLNNLRMTTGLPVFMSENNLDISAQNHSNYMQTNNSVGHGEISGKIDYTGETPSQRAIYAGYTHVNVGENVYYGSTATIYSAIDGLMSAIYHRFSFLSLEYDEVGIGMSENNKFYTYNMANSVLKDLCINGIYSGGSYYLPCADSTKKVDASAYLAQSDHIKQASPQLILWPSAESSDIPPVFYEESPDPLPLYSVSGYPISVEFNSAKFTTPPMVNSLTLSDESGIQLNDIVLMNHDNDPNGKFTSYQFALFPKKRLEWGSMYNAELIYNDGSQQRKNWCFVTRTLDGTVEKFYRIENNSNISLNVVSGTSYAIYVVPDDGNDTLGGTSYSSTATVDFSYIDSNTFYIKLTGNIGNYSNFTFNNGQKINLTVSSVDTATLPKQSTCVQQNNASPDYKSILSIYGAIVHGAGVHDFSFDTLIKNVKENTTYNNSNPLTIKIPKNEALKLTYDPTETIFKGKSVQNNVWNFDDSDPLDYVIKYTGSSIPTEKTRFSLYGTIRVEEGEVGKFILETTIQSGTGGDSNNDNNSDRETLEKRL